MEMTKKLLNLGYNKQVVDRVLNGLATKFEETKNPVHAKEVRKAHTLIKRIDKHEKTICNNILDGGAKKPSQK